MGYGILLYTANVLARTASYALFLSMYDAQNLPYTYLGIALVATLISSLILRLNTRFPLGKVLLGIHAFLLLTLAGYWLGLSLWPVSWLLFSLPIYFGVNNSLTISSFWNLLGRICNLQQSKRLFGMFTASEQIATILTGFLAPLLVAGWGTSSLFLCATIVMAATLALLSDIVRTNTKQMTLQEERKAASSAPKASGNGFKERYVILIILEFTLYVVGIYFVDNIFYTQAESQYPSQEALAAFIGIFFGVFGVLSLLVQFFIAGRVLRRFGVQAMILATPVGLFVVMLLFALTSVWTPWVAVLFWLVAIANLFRLTMDAVDSSAVNLLYQPLPALQRTQVQTLVNGIVYPLSIGCAGLLLLFFSEILHFGPLQLSYLLLLLNAH
jgi:AAA family ATP:ADP antiporter